VSAVRRKFPDSPLLRAAFEVACPALLMYSPASHAPLMRLLACEKRCKQW
jgi:hypothetical protein